MRKMLILIAFAAPAALIACGGATTTNQQAEVPASQPAAQPATPPPAPQQQEAAATPQPAAPSRPAASTPSTTAHTRPPAPATPTPTATAYRPPEPPKPQMIEVPAGTVLEMELVAGLSTRSTVAGDTFKAKVTDPVSIGGEEVIPVGSIVEGTVTESISAKKMSGQASLSLQFSRLQLPDGHTVEISAMLTEKGKKISSRTGGIVGGSAAGGAVLGRVIGKDTKGAVVGAVLGAAVGTGVAAAQKGQDLKLPAGTGLSVEISNPIQVPVPPKRT